MAQTRAKKFEQKFREDWLSTIPQSFCYRLVDVTSGYYGIRNVCDFICYKKPDIYLIDCKSSESNTIGFAAIRQFEDMLQFKDIPGVHTGIIWWSIPNDKIIWVPINTLAKIKAEGKKSFNVKMLDDPEYECLEIPVKKLRTFLKGDYSALIDYYKE